MVTLVIRVETQANTSHEISANGREDDIQDDGCGDGGRAREPFETALGSSKSNEEGITTTTTT